MKVSKLIAVCLIICFCTLAQATVDISNNKSIPGIEINNQSILEGDKSDANIIQFTVSLSHPSDQIITVDFVTSEDTAIAEVDFITFGGVLIFQAQETIHSLEFEIIGDDLDEPDETFEIHLLSPTNASIAIGTGVATIVNDDETAAVLAIPMLSLENLLVLVLFMLYFSYRKKQVDFQIK